MNTQDILKIYNESITDKEILGSYLQEKDINQPYLRSKNTYTWYYAIAKALQPKIIAEIGCRFGYSLRAMLYGSPAAEFVYVWDNESYENGCLTHIESLLNNANVPHQINKQDTQQLEAFKIDRKVDLFHVDGDHSIQGAYYDLKKAYDCLSETGILLIDDTATSVCPGVQAAVQLFCTEYPVECIEVPSFHGLTMLIKKH